MDVRFHALAVGQPFEWRGSHYIKVNSLLARSQESGRQVMVPRSEVVSIAQPPELPSPPAAAGPLQPDKVRAAFAAHHAACLAAIALLDEATAERLGAELEQARQRFLAALGL